MTDKHPILVLTEMFPPIRGGTSTWFDQVYPLLGEREIHIIARAVEQSGSVDAHHANTIHRINMARIPWLRPESLALYIRMIVKGIGILFKNDFKVIHAGRVLPEGLVGVVLARLFNKPLVIYAHGEEITVWRQHANKFKALVKTFQKADCIIANSNFTRDLLLNVVGVDASRIELISPGVNPEEFRPGLPCDDLRDSLGLTKQKKLILSIGRLTRRKGFDRVIESLPFLIEKGVDPHYAVIGPGEDRDYLLALAKEKGVADRFHLLGNVPQADMPRWMNATDLFVMANRKTSDLDAEGFGIVFIEAAACGKPAIAGDHGGTGDAVIHNETGLRINGNDLNTVQQSLLSLLTDDALIQRLSNNGLQRARAELTWSEIAKKTALLNQKLDLS
ncbi:MAG: glycosyltransferase family 4 protein [Magnetococcales bacterium]|nr:glycosyltransferase family 4 protein [Magnetococcales bacterium]